MARKEELLKNAIHRLRVKRFKWGIPAGNFNLFTDFIGNYSAVGTIVKETTKCADVDIVHNVYDVLPVAAMEIIQVMDDFQVSWEDIADLLEATHNSDGEEY